MKTGKHKNQILICILLWAALLVVLAMTPKPIIMMIVRKKTLLPYVHMAAYGLLAVICAIFFALQKSFLGIRMSAMNIFLLANAAAAFVGGGTEILQIFSVDRTPDWMDFYCDMAGALTGVLIFLAVTGKIRIFSAGKSTAVRSARARINRAAA